MFVSPLSRINAILADAFAGAGLPTAHARASASRFPDVDLQCNGVMKAAQTMGRDPRLAAEGLRDVLAARPEFFEVSVAGPGFLNMRLATEFVVAKAEEAAADANLGLADAGRGRLAVIDFGGPNVAKPLHVGHMRSLVLGESLRRIMAALGWHVVADVHLGDWGLQMGMLTSEIRRRHPHALWFTPDFDGPWPQLPPVSLDELETLYPEVAAACAKNAALMAQARADTAALQAGDPGLTALWRSLRSLSLGSQMRDFASLGVTFDLLLGESDAQAAIAPMIADLKERGIAIEDDGALVVPVAEADDTKEMPPLLLEKSDGAALYATTDLAALAERAGRMGAKRIVYVVDQRQALHFEQVFRAAWRSGLAGDAELVHAGFGTVNGADGKPYKTRSGGVARLSDLLSEAVAKAAARLDETGYGADLDEAARAELARKVGIAAVKFADLSGDRRSGYVFDPERLVSFEGKTGPYLQYACVRIGAILSKSVDQGKGPGEMLPACRSENALLLACLGFSDAVVEAERQMQPGVLAEYAFTLAQAFSRFYSECPVLGAEDERTSASRLSMCRLAGRTLRRSLDLLGIEVPDRM